MNLKNTYELMTSDDYGQRFLAEYLQTKERYERLKKFNTRIEAAELTLNKPPKHDCPLGLLKSQQKTMGEYLHSIPNSILEKEALDLENEYNRLIMDLRDSRNNSDKQAAEMQKSSDITQLRLKDISVGETFKVGQYEFVVLEHSKETTAVILKDLLHEREQFGENNNFENSYVDKRCEEFGKEIAGIVGEDNLIEHAVDLTSDDGLKDYGSIKRKMSLLTTELYCRYVGILDKNKIDAWWWLATPWSTLTHGGSSCINCVSPSGSIDDLNYYGDGGVRPFCILNSDISVS